MRFVGKRLRLLLLSALVLTALSVDSLNAFASDNGKPTAEIRVDSLSAQAGTTVDANISIKNNPGILGAQIMISYPSELNLVDAKAGAAFAQLTLTKAGKYASPCSFVWDGQELGPESIKDGTILSLTFSISPNVPAGSTIPINISSVPNSFVDSDLNPVQVVTSGGVITVAEPTRTGISSALGKYNDTSVYIKVESELDTTTVKTILAGYRESGEMLSCIIKTEVLSKGENIILFDKINGATAYRAFLLDKQMRPCCPAITVTEERLCTVSFTDYDGKVLSQQTVDAGDDAVPPDGPQRAGYVFVGWDGSYKNITSDCTLIAQYEKDITPTIVVNNTTVAAGATDVEVTISVRNNPGILGMTLTLAYDTTALTLKSAENGAAVSDVLTMTKPGIMVSPCNFIWDGMELDPENIRDGALLILRFDVSSAAHGDYPVAITYRNGNITDNNLQAIQFTVQNGSIFVK